MTGLGPRTPTAFINGCGGPRHHNPEEQVEKIRWQHPFDQLHPQTGRRMKPTHSLPRKKPKPAV
ncbi:Leukocyte Immunoglobulin-Like Receptor Subfamily B Member 4 [Manis pentadactyla]|nr:Leukocyte Immunoglobulin-Like Receptor Subfamily B Member 4 [Manis pentadactyla]